MASLNRKAKVALVALLASAGISSYGSLAESRNLSRYLGDAELHQDSKKLNGDEVSLAFVKKYAHEIVTSSERYGLFPEAVAAIIMAQNHNRPRYEDWKDWLALHLHFNNPSLGPSQVKVLTASNLDKMFHGIERNRQKLEERLEDPKRNIDYTAMTYRDLLDEPNRLPLAEPSSAFNTDSALNNPHLIAVTASEYQRGISKKKLEDARPNQFGLRVLVYLAKTGFNQIFGQNSRVTEKHRQKYRDYLSQHIGK